MGGMSPIHWVIVLVVVLLIFGTKKLRNIGSDMGAAVKGFKDGIKPEDAKAAEALKLKEEAEAKAASDLKAKKEAEAKAAIPAVVKKSTITCTKGKLIKKVTAVNPKCPTGYKKK